MEYSFKKEKMIPSRGFTLVETLVAISILILVVIGPMTIAAKGMKMGFFANEQTTAVFMAQEAIEAIQRLRDENALDVLFENGNNGWGRDTWGWYGVTANGFDDCLKITGCDLDISGPSFIDCGSVSCTLEEDTSTANVIYGYGGVGWVPTIFTRTIKVGSLTGGGVPVTVTVTWPTSLFSSNMRTVTLQTWIYDHYNHYE